MPIHPPGVYPKARIDNNSRGKNKLIFVKLVYLECCLSHRGRSVYMEPLDKPNSPTDDVTTGKNVRDQKLDDPWNIESWINELDSLLETESLDQVRQYFRLVLKYFPSSVPFAIRFPQLISLSCGLERCMV